MSKSNKWSNQRWHRDRWRNRKQADRDVRPRSVDVLSGVVKFSSSNPTLHPHPHPLPCWALAPIRGISVTVHRNHILVVEENSVPAFTQHNQSQMCAHTHTHTHLPVHAHKHLQATQRKTHNNLTPLHKNTASILSKNAHPTNTSKNYI